MTYIHIHDMVFHMKTTLNISDVTMRRLKEEAARQGRTMSDMVDEALQSLFRKRSKPRKLPPLPQHNCGRPLVDIANRDALYDAMEAGDD